MTVFAKIVFAMGLSALALSGCGDKNKGSAQAAPQATPQEAAQAAPAVQQESNRICYVTDFDTRGCKKGDTILFLPEKWGNEQLPVNFAMGKDELKDVIDRTQFAVSTEETRYYLNGLYIHAKNEGEAKVLRVVATDGHRLACVESPLPKGAENMAGVIVPRKTVSEVRKLLDDSSTDNITIALSENKIRFTMEDVILTSKLIDGTYPDYERVIPTDNDKVLELGVKELSSAVDRVSVVAERTRAIKMITNKNHVTITTSSPDLGSAMEEVEAKYDSESLEIGYNFRYLLDILSEVKGESVKISFADGSSPSVIHDTSDANAIYVLMPMRV